MKEKTTANTFADILTFHVRYLEVWIGCKKKLQGEVIRLGRFTGLEVLRFKNIHVCKQILDVK